MALLGKRCTNSLDSNGSYPRDLELRGLCGPEPGNESRISHIGCFSPLCSQKETAGRCVLVGTVERVMLGGGWGLLPWAFLTEKKMTYHCKWWY